MTESTPTKSQRAKCEYCGYSVRLNVSGDPQVHRVFAANKAWLCPGSSHFPHGDDVAEFLVDTSTGRGRHRDGRDRRGHERVRQDI